MSTVHSAYAEGFDIQSEDHAVRSSLPRGQPTFDLQPTISTQRRDCHKCCSCGTRSVDSAVPTPTRCGRPHICGRLRAKWYGHTSPYTVATAWQSAPPHPSCERHCSHPTPPAHDLNNRQPNPTVPAISGSSTGTVGRTFLSPHSMATLRRDSIGSQANTS